MPTSCERNHCPTGEGRDGTGPSSRYEGRVFQPLLHCAQESGGLRPILGLRILNGAFHKPPFKMLMQNCVFGCIRPQVRSAALEGDAPMRSVASCVMFHCFYFVFFCTVH